MTPEDTFKKWAYASLVQCPDRWEENMPQAIYHAYPGINASSMKSKTTQEMRHYATYPRPVTYAKTLGDVLHKAILEPDIFETPDGVEEWFQYSPRGGLNTQAALAALAAFPDKPLVTPEIVEKARRLRDAIFLHGEASRILACKAKKELSGFAWDEDSQVMRKIRIDFLPSEDHPEFGEPFFADVKMTRSIDEIPFWAQILELKYHLSAAYYVDVEAQINNTPRRNIFTYIAVTGPTGQGQAVNAEPYMARTFDIGGMESKLSLIDHPKTGGRILYRNALNKFANAIQTWTWEAYEHEEAFQLTAIRPFSTFKQ